MLSFQIYFPTFLSVILDLYTLTSQRSGPTFLTFRLSEEFTEIVISAIPQLFLRVAVAFYPSFPFLRNLRVRQVWWKCGFIAGHEIMNTIRDRSLNEYILTQADVEMQSLGWTNVEIPASALFDG